jgi:2-methylisocitrate lyase-like PEP mutase family enzyme
MSGQLRQHLAQRPAVLAPGVYDPLSALLAEQAGFDALYLSGAAIAYTQLGRPDIGLVTLSELVDVVWRIGDRVGLPLIIDADTGFGNALNTQRTVRLLEKAGASAIQIEDQTSPKRCGHLAGKSLVAKEEMAGGRPRSRRSLSGVRRGCSVHRGAADPGRNAPHRRHFRRTGSVGRQHGRRRGYADAGP